jgi:hypothetical protein
MHAIYFFLFGTAFGKKTTRKPGIVKNLNVEIVGKGGQQTASQQTKNQNQTFFFARNAFLPLVQILLVTSCYYRRPLVLLLIQESYYILL